MEQTKGATSLASRLEALISPQVEALGYELLDVEYQTKSQLGGALLRLFIDHPNSDPTKKDSKKISHEDCMKVDRGLDDFFESKEFTDVLSSSFHLEVSSPGLDRPLKQIGDFIKFTSQNVRINTFRPITQEELGNDKYFAHHKKQKKFFGILLGVEGEKIVLEADKERITIPHSLVSQAHLDIASTISLDE